MKTDAVVVVSPAPMFGVKLIEMIQKVCGFRPGCPKAGKPESDYGTRQVSGE